jgi:hypothetical protein
MAPLGICPAGPPLSLALTSLPCTPIDQIIQPRSWITNHFLLCLTPPTYFGLLVFRNTICYWKKVLNTTTYCILITIKAAIKINISLMYSVVARNNKMVEHLLRSINVKICALVEIYKSGKD